MNKISGLKIGEMAPEFTAVDIYEKKYLLSNALLKGEVVLIFIRGQ